MGRALRLALVISFLTAFAWGGRIGLLSPADDLADFIRVAGSILIGALTAVVLVVPQLYAWRRRALFVFAGWTAAIWLRSLVVNLGGSGTLAFKLVHTILALGFFGLAWWAWSFARSHPVPTPYQAHSEQ